MHTPLFIPCQHADDIPTLDQLQHLVTAERHVVLCFPLTASASNQVVDKSGLIQQIAGQLPDCSVFDSGSNAETTNITIKKVVAMEEVLTHADAILAAVRQFRCTAQQLLQMLADKLNLPMDAFADRSLPWHLAPDVRRGLLNDGWSYWFHGGDCQFKNSVTGQILDIRLGFKDETGVLDPSFFYHFLTTTPEFEAVANLFPQAFHDVNRALEILEQHGYLTRVQTQDLTVRGHMLTPTHTCYPLHGVPLTYTDPTASVADADWEATQ